MRIYLLGYMYSGKTTLGNQLAKCLRYDFADLDQMFEFRYHTSIPIFFKRYGEEAFRKLEQQMLHTTSTMDNTVIALGGGTPCFFDNMEWINAHGKSVYLQMSVEDIISRAHRSRKIRPVLADKTSDELHAFITHQLSQRQKFYAQAHIAHPAASPNISHLVQSLF